MAPKPPYLLTATSVAAHSPIEKYVSEALVISEAGANLNWRSTTCDTFHWLAHNVGDPEDGETAVAEVESPDTRLPKVPLLAAPLGIVLKIK